MNLRDLVRSVLREELAPESKPIQSEPSSGQAASDRQASLARLATLKEQAATIEAQESDISGDVGRMAQLEVELDELRLRISNQRALIWCGRLENMFALERELARLRSTCSRQLDQFIESMNGELDRLVKLTPAEQIGFGDKNLFTDNPKVPRHTYSNAPAISRRVKAVIAARSRAEELKVLDRTEEELIQELSEMHAALPSIQGELELVRV